MPRPLTPWPFGLAWPGASTTGGHAFAHAPEQTLLLAGSVVRRELASPVLIASIEPHVLLCVTTITVDDDASATTGATIVPASPAAVPRANPAADHRSTRPNRCRRPLARCAISLLGSVVVRRFCPVGARPSPSTTADRLDRINPPTAAPPTMTRSGPVRSGQYATAPWGATGLTTPFGRRKGRYALRSSVIGHRSSPWRAPPSISPSTALRPDRAAGSLRPPAGRRSTDRMAGRGVLRR